MKKPPRPAPETAIPGVFRRRTGSGLSSSLNGPPGRNVAVAYRRVSKGGQDPENQRADIELVARLRGLELVDEYVETVSAAAPTRPAFDAMMLAAARRRFRHLIIWAIDRFGRSMVGNINDVMALDLLGVEVISVREPWLDMEGPARSLLLAVFSWWAEQERARISERTRAGLERARAQGKRLGRPRRVTPAQLERARQYLDDDRSIRWIAQALKVPRATLHRALVAEATRRAQSSLRSERLKKETKIRGRKPREKEGRSRAARNRTIGGQ